jgi:hypothetical protein
MNFLLPGRRAKRRELRKLNRITSLVLHGEPQHVVASFNAAKGGDPMSHGSAEGSVKFVRELLF